MGRCFAHNKNSFWASTSERRSKNDICYVMKEEDYKDMVESGRCDTKECPFYKENREDVRHE